MKGLKESEAKTRKGWTPPMRHAFMYLDSDREFSHDKKRGARFDVIWRGTRFPIIEARGGRIRVLFSGLSVVALISNT